MSGYCLCAAKYRGLVVFRLHTLQLSAIHVVSMNAIVVYYRWIWSEWLIDGYFINDFFFFFYMDKH